MRKCIFPILISLVCLNLFGQTKNKAYLSYIDTYKDVAIHEMNEYGIPASITMAQGLLESGAGKSDITLEGNNHFGIKCQKNWSGERIYHDDDAKAECFRKYPSAIDSYEDHSKFLKAGQRYASLFDLSPTDYKGWANGLKKAGYATDPTYPTRLIKIIEDYELNLLDNQSANANKKVPTVADVKAETKVAPKPKEKKSFFDFLFKKKEKKETPKDSVKDQDRVFSEGNYIAEINPYRTHKVDEINGAKYVLAKEGDTYASIAEEFDMFEKELLKANEVQYGANPQTGDIVFISKKKNKGDEDTYKVKSDETMYQISQKKGIKVRALYKINGLIYGKQPSVGDVIKLR